MNDYREVRIDFTPCNEDITDVMAALLADIGFESFVPDDTGLTAYVKAADFDLAKVEQAVAEMPFDNVKASVAQQLIEGQDWNSEWEKNYFKPIVVGDKVVIHSTFHTDVPSAQYDIVIDPKMAFGTGHHATTALVIAALLDTDLNGKEMIDMGTGTGILAILASMRGAAHVTAIEIDEFAYQNAIENLRLNNTNGILLINGDASALDNIEPVDVFVANINRNVITGDINRYVKSLKNGGTMILSGFYVEDIPVIMESAAPLGLVEVEHHERERWCCLRLKLQK
jgi:ribosomal protein L11 methyltransferase